MKKEQINIIQPPTRSIKQDLTDNSAAARMFIGALDHHLQQSNDVKGLELLHQVQQAIQNITDVTFKIKDNYE